VNVWRLVIREISYRKLNFGLGCLSVLVAVGCLVAELTLLRGHDLRTEQVIARKQAQTEAEMRRLEDDYRKIMKKLGFNILILPKEQNLSDFYSEGYASKYMPEDYVHKLANSRIISIRHLLPMLEQKAEWPEYRRKIILIGTRGEVPLVHRDPKKPIIEVIPPGTIVLGYELHRSLSLKPGSKVKFMGRDLTVGKCHDERGTRDDITAWIDLGTAQELLGRKGLINAILALECHCVWTGLPKVREEIARILENKVQVKEKASKALTRAEARARAETAAKAAIEAEKKNRLKLRREREGFAALLIPVVTVGGIVWIGLLAFGNVRERRTEIGILRALGVRSRHIFAIFLVKSCLTGLAGAVIGYAGGFLIGAVSGEALEHATIAAALFDPILLALVLVIAPVLSGLAGFIPAMIAAGQDPAVVLQQE